MPKYIRQLEEKRLIGVEPTKVQTRDGKVRNGTLRFTIRPIQEAVDYKLERDLAALPNPKHTKEKSLKPKLDPVRACVRFLSRDRETIPAQNGLPASLEACGAVADESKGSDESR